MNSNKITSFAPVANRAAQILILGSMPGEASLCAGQYYAHSRNSFWKIMGSIVGFRPDKPYDARLTALQNAGIALWDVLRACTRQGSLDAAIEDKSIIANNFHAFLPNHPCLTHIYFNGATAERYYNKLVLPDLPSLSLHYCRLPSTSPAHAALTFDKKLALWRAALEIQQHNDLA